jgi:hypothetical protein
VAWLWIWLWTDGPIWRLGVELDATVRMIERNGDPDPGGSLTTMSPTLSAAAESPDTPELFKVVGREL